MDNLIANLIEIEVFGLFIDFEGSPGLESLGFVDETHFEGTAGDYALTSGEEVEADDILEKRTLACTLTAQDSDTG